MWKSVFLAAGVFACILGAELLLIDSAMVKPVDGAGPATSFTAPDWAPWALISAGAVTILHVCAGGGAGAPAHPKPLPTGRFGQL